MKKIKFFRLICAVFLMLFSAGNVYAQQVQSKKTQAENPVKKILITYYSRSGNTRNVAKAIEKNIGGTIFEIQTQTPYPSDYKSTTEQAKEEIANGYRPPINDLPSDIAQYDIVFIGSPNWWGTIAPAVSTFLQQANLSGKTVIPFVTHGGGGVQNTVKDLTEQCKGCNIADSFVGYEDASDKVADWLKDKNF